MHSIGRRCRRGTVRRIFCPVPASGAEFATRDEAATLVKQAIVRVAEVGIDKAKLEFMDQEGKFVDRDLYLIVIDNEGIPVVHGQNAKLVGELYFVGPVSRGRPARDGLHLAFELDKAPAVALRPMLERPTLRPAA